MSSCVFTAAEPSGDRLAGPVLDALAEWVPAVSWVGHAGERMARCAALTALGDVRDLSGAGLVELIPRLPSILRGRRSLQGALAAAPLAVFVDGPDLHLPLARAARARGATTICLVCPQFWAWRPGRRAAIGAAFDLVLCLFPFEVPALRSWGIAAHCVGHPAADEPLEERPQQGLIALLPGSRPAEVRRNLGPFVAAARAAAGQGSRIVVPWRLRAEPPELDGVEFDRAEGAAVLRRCDVALVAAGTASLEAALLGVPVVVSASAHPLTAAVASRLLRSQHLALPNILLGREAVPEIHQDLSVGPLAGALQTQLAGSGAMALAQELRAQLGSGFAGRAADRIAPLLPARA